jgi:hypothetical protein
MAVEHFLGASVVPDRDIDVLKSEDKISFTFKICVFFLFTNLEQS